MSFRTKAISAAWTPNDVDYPAQIRPNGAFISSTPIYAADYWITARIGRFSRPKIVYGYNDLYNTQAIGTSSVATIAIFQKSEVNGGPGLRIATVFTQDLKLVPSPNFQSASIYLAANVDYYVGVIVENNSVTTPAYIYSCYAPEEPLIRRDTTFAYYQSVGYSYATYIANSAVTDLSGVADATPATHIPIVSLWIRNQ